MLEIVGYTGAFLLAICALPQTIECIIKGNAKGINLLFLMSWYLGEILMLYYCVVTVGAGPLFYNYLANSLMLTFIVRYKFLERK